MKKTYLTRCRLQYTIVDRRYSPVRCFTHSNLKTCGPHLARLVRLVMKDLIDPNAPRPCSKKLAILRNKLFQATSAPDHLSVTSLLDRWNDFCNTELNGAGRIELVRSRKFIERVLLGRYVIRDGKERFFETTDQLTVARHELADLGEGRIIDRKKPVRHLRSVN